MSLTAPHYVTDRALTFVELPAHLRYLDEPLTPSELNRFRHGLDQTMVVAYCVLSVLMLAILASTVWLHRALGG